MLSEKLIYNWIISVNQSGTEYGLCGREIWDKNSILREDVDGNLLIILLEFLGTTEEANKRYNEIIEKI